MSRDAYEHLGLVDELDTAADFVRTTGEHSGSVIMVNFAAHLQARAARVRESLASIGRAELTTHPQNRAVKAWLDDVTGPLAAPSPGAGAPGPTFTAPMGPLCEEARAAGRYCYVTTYRDGESPIKSSLLFKTPELANECARRLRSPTERKEP